jgi:hypothetical protein
MTTAYEAAYKAYLDAEEDYCALYSRYAQCLVGAGGTEPYIPDTLIARMNAAQSRMQAAALRMADLEESK